MGELFYFLAAAQILLGIYMLVEGLRWLGMVRRRLVSYPGFYSPRVAVICPCKGREPGLDRNLLSLCEFDYPNYEVFFTMASSEDPAYEVARRLMDRPKPKVHLILAGMPAGCGEKVNNLRVAVDQLPPDFDVFVFADSDGRPGRRWLQHLVAPLADSRIGASTTMRWFLPGRRNLATALLAAWNAPIATMLGEHKNNFCWGGGAAIRREMFAQAAVPEYWKSSVSDDFSMTTALQRAGRPIHFVPECLTLSFPETDFDGLLELTNRQIIITRVYAPRLWALAAAAHLLYCITLLLGLGLLLGTLIAGTPVLHLLLVLLAPPLLAALRGTLRILAVGEIFPAWKQKVMSQSWIWTVLAAVVPFLYAVNFVTSTLTRRIRWRGIHYELFSPGQTKILAR